MLPLEEMLWFSRRNDDALKALMRQRVDLSPMECLYDYDQKGDGSMIASFLSGPGRELAPEIEKWWLTHWMDSTLIGKVLEASGLAVTFEDVIVACNEKFVEEARILVSIGKLSERDSDAKTEGGIQPKRYVVESSPREG